MYTLSLNGAWQFRQAGSSEWLPAQVPGGVHTDLLALGRIPDPFDADNELAVQWIGENDWQYRRKLHAGERLLRMQKVFLVCDGLDTLARVYLNGEYLGSAENQFRRFRWEIRARLLPGENELMIEFGSPLRYTRTRQAQLPLVGGGDLPGGPHLRKSPCQWGWDWGPKLPPIGIWKNIWIEGRSSGRMSNVHLRQEHQDGIVRLSASLEVQNYKGTPLTSRLHVTGPDGQTWVDRLEVQAIGDSQPPFAYLEVEIGNPKLWWPNGYGAQPLYTARIELLEGKRVVDQRTYTVGLRRIELRQQPDAWGKSFTFVVNGVPVFAKGANWIPADAFPTRLDQARLERLVADAAAANMNMLRIWGGGYYPEDVFYDLCDRYGILVWQDFMFACGIYPADTAYLDNFLVEARQNIRRLRHHASLAIWCGNNEMEQGWCDWGWNKPDDPTNQRLKDGYDRLFHNLLPDLLLAEDPERPYWPSSASSGTPFENANGQEQGDCHYWDVWHGHKPFTAYRDQFPRFMSEFGFQALPPLKTIATYARPEDWNITSYIMEHHQRSRSGNILMIAQMTDSFRLPKDFPNLVYLSLVLQAEGIRYGVEHWRRNRLRVSGTLFWQLNDNWPVASWSSIDYFGRWKALHYAARRFYAPLLLSVEDQAARMNIHLTSDLTTPWIGELHWRLEDLQGEVLRQGSAAAPATPLSDTLLAQLDFSAEVNDETRRRLVFIAELRQGDVLLSRQVLSFIASKHLELANPHLLASAALDGGELVIRVQAGSLARFVELALEGADVVFSDNYFDLPANCEALVHAPLPAGWTLAQAQAALRVRSLWDSFTV